MQFSLISIGSQQRDIQDVCRALGIGLIAYSPLGLGMLTGKYDVSSGRLPKGPRGLLFRQILPGLEPLLGTMEAIAQDRRKSMSQVSVTVHVPLYAVYQQSLLVRGPLIWTHSYAQRPIKWAVLQGMHEQQQTCGNR